ncbi:TraB/GumN family protein [Prosthecomicrobium hirschii]|uniref:TraB/GumN family protein n=1 Tax=Prosthecodimorpha hirschii TaxID=665126 RepID=UPI00222069BE|nr:TraB/GumN family protein [Prosthecomicrobium hirschii]MCW1843072.1 TraB/GumN family protein [Prosthecomicrobium hirschii]
MAIGTVGRRWPGRSVGGSVGRLVGGLRWIGAALAVAIALVQPVAAAPDLWRIGDGDTSIYLFGTTHLGGRDVVWRSALFDDILARSRSVWLEAEPAANPADLEAEMIAAGGDPTRGLLDRLAGPERERLNRIAGRLGLRPDRLAGLRPWAAAMLLVEAAARRDGYVAGGIEREIVGLAEARGASVSGLEAAETTLEIFAGLEATEAAALLSVTLADLDSPAPQYRRLLAAWKSGDEPAIEAAGIAEMRAASEALYRGLIADRNRRWLDQFEMMMLGSGEHVVVVGSLHLVGPDRLQTLLAARGYSVERLPQR